MIAITQEIADRKREQLLVLTWLIPQLADPQPHLVMTRDRLLDELPKLDEEFPPVQPVCEDRIRAPKLLISNRNYSETLQNAVSLDGRLLFAQS